MSSFGLNTVTQGLALDSRKTQTSIVSSGLFSILIPQPNTGAVGPPESHSALTTQGTVLTKKFSSQVGFVQTPGGTQAITGHIGIPIGDSGGLSIDLGAYIKKAVNPYGALFGAQDSDSNTTTYTGSDLRILVDLVNADTTGTFTPHTKQLVEATTFTISIHREKAAVRAAGYINPKGFARGRRTIAGTMVLTQFTVDALYHFLEHSLGHDVSKDTHYVKVDQLPPFNMTLIFADEFGNISWRRVLGVEFVTDGVVYSSNDLLSEQTISYMAADFTPLVLLQDNAVFDPLISQTIVKNERSVRDVLADKNKQNSVPKVNIFPRLTLPRF